MKRSKTPEKVGDTEKTCDNKLKIKEKLLFARTGENN